MDFKDDNADETSDEDYIPGKDSDEDAVSEASDGGVDSDASSGDEAKIENCRKRKLKKQTKCNASKSFKRKGGIKLEDENNENSCDNIKDQSPGETLEKESTEALEEREKQRVNRLWDDFLSDMGNAPSKSKPVVKPIIHPDETVDQEKKAVKTKEFNFAGEIVRVTSEVDSNPSKIKKVGSETDRIEIENKLSGPSLPSNGNVEKPGGLMSVLNKISGLKKMSTLEKSRLDWSIYKEGEGISEDLKSFNRGKNGYLEKQAFLQRTDERQFNLEKQFRLNSGKR